PADRADPPEDNFPPRRTAAPFLTGSAAAWPSHDGSSPAGADEPGVEALGGSLRRRFRGGRARRPPASIEKTKEEREKERRRPPAGRSWPWRRGADKLPP